MQRGARLGVDVGGTFTDLVALVDGRLVTGKVPSTPRDQSEGVMSSLRAAGVEEAAAFAHGMTVATNALLERRGARTGLVTTAGFRDVIEIGRQDRPALYALAERRPEPLVPRELRFCVRERMGPDGELQPLDDGTVREAIEGLREAEVEAVAVCLLFAFLHPEHERAVGEAVREALDAVHVSLSSEVLPEFREYERFSTTVADAYLAPRLAAYVARASGYEDVLTFDMGGTSTDVAPVLGGEASTTTESVVAGVPIKLPMVDVHSVSAGGGSIAWADPGGALRVGPRSAGAEPGPAAYGAGGEDATVTDANLVLGYLEDGVELGREIVLQRGLAEAALARVGERLGLDPLETALGVVRVANAEMTRALRVISVERGLDPRDFALVALGGAGAMHACALADELGMRTLVVPKAAGVLSALGLAISDVRRDYVEALLGEPDAARPEDAFGDLEARASEDLYEPKLARAADLRYRGQSFELTVDAGDLEALEARFHEAHEQRYGYRMEEEPVELVNARVVATVAVDKPALKEQPSESDGRAGRRRASFEGEWVEVDGFDRTRMGAGSEVSGPALVEFPEATCVVAAGWAGRVDEAGSLVLGRRDG